MRTRSLSFLLLVSASGCICMRAQFAPEGKAAPTLTAEIARLAPKCEQWFVRECEVGAVKAVWLFRPRIDGPAEAAAYDGTSGELLYQRQYGSSGDWAFTPVRVYGDAPACRPSLDSAGAERACAWFEARAVPAPAGANVQGGYAGDTSATTPASSTPTPAPSPSAAPTP